MTPRRPFALVLALLASAALARSAAADDSQAAAAAAAAQAVGAAGAAGAAPGAAAGAGGQASAGPFLRSLGPAPVIPKAKHRGKKSRARRRSAAAKRAAESKYKSRVLVDDTVESYRFDADGNPLSSSSKPKRKTALKRAKRSSSDDAKPGACSTDEPCTVNNSDADAL